MVGGNCGQQILQSCDVKHFVHAQAFSVQKNLHGYFRYRVPGTVRLLTERQRNHTKSTKRNQTCNCTVRNPYAREGTLHNIHVTGPTFLLAGDNAHAFPNNMIVTPHAQ